MCTIYMCVYIYESYWLNLNDSRLNFIKHAKRHLPVHSIELHERDPDFVYDSQPLSSRSPCIDPVVLRYGSMLLKKTQFSY